MAHRSVGSMSHVKSGCPVHWLSTAILSHIIFNLAE